MQLASPRYFQDAALLHHYGGAVAAVRGGGQVPDVAPATPVEMAPLDVPIPPRVPTGRSEDIAAIAAQSQHPGFPSIGYSGG